MRPPTMEDQVKAAFTAAEKLGLTFHVPFQHSSPSNILDRYGRWDRRRERYSESIKEICHTVHRGIQSTCCKFRKPSKPQPRRRESNLPRATFLCHYGRPKEEANPARGYGVPDGLLRW